MNLSSILQRIQNVESNSHVNILLELNDNYSLLVEGSFSVSRNSDELASSAEYMGLDYSFDVFSKIKFLLENQEINVATFSNETGELTLELQSGVKFESFFGDGDYESWELFKNNVSIYGSECGTVIYY